MQSEVTFFRPETLQEALKLLAQRTPDGKPLAGGTNIVVEMRDGHHANKSLVDLSRVRELHGIQRQNGYIVIGGGTTITELLEHPLVGVHGSPLKESAAVFANPLIRNRATVAGNLVDASPAADTAPPLLALGAEVQLVCETSTRWMSLEDFIVGVRKTQLKPDELMLAVRWPVPGPRSAGAYYKLGLRKADAISVISAAAMLECDEEKRCTLARIALGAVAPRPIRTHAAEDFLQGKKLTEETILEAARLSAEAARPINDIRGSAAYRKRVTEVTVKRLLTRSAEALNQ
jgi:carbon-monoxide dehydrogenase medium subunit